MKPKILFVAPIGELPSGQSIISDKVKKVMNEAYEIEFINLIKEGHAIGFNSFSRAKTILKLILEFYKKSKNVDFIYLTPSESIAGNFRDFFFYFIAYSKLSNFIVHFHGGQLEDGVINKSNILKYINKKIFDKLKMIWVLGESHKKTFSNWTSSNKIHVLNNFFDKDLKIDSNQKKWINDQNQIINVLYLGNLYQGKGYEYLVDAIQLLNHEELTHFQFDFAGNIEEGKMDFLNKIEKFPNVQFHGSVKGEKKKNLLLKSDVLCFPSYIIEGQGISILEAYANGLAVITTKVGGIIDVFEDTVNGWSFKPQDSLSLANTLRFLISNKKMIADIGKYNLNDSELKYSEFHFETNLKNLIEKIKK